MKRILRDISFQFITFIMIGIMVMLIANKSIFLHSHMLANGIVISHSHPYDKSNDSKPYKTHHHTNAEFLFIENLDILFLTVFVSLVLGSIYMKARYPIQVISLYFPFFFNAKKGRAPPVS